MRRTSLTLAEISNIKNSVFGSLELFPRLVQYFIFVITVLSHLSDVMDNIQIIGGALADAIFYDVNM